MWAAWKKKRACGFKAACGLASCTSFCVVQANVSCLENLSSGDQSNCRSLLASAPSAADEQAVVSSSVAFFCCCVLRQDSNWGEGRGDFAVLWSYVQGLMWQMTVWMKQPKVCQLTAGCSAWLLAVMWLCCQSLFRGWSQGQWLLTVFFSVPTGHPCPSIIKPPLARLAGAYSKAWWKQGVVVECGHWGTGCVSRSAGGLWTG